MLFVKHCNIFLRVHTSHSITVYLKHYFVFFFFIYYEEQNINKISDRNVICKTLYHISKSSH